jgi:glycosyltransferase A (GT-A) superfamily protein (DUF2064 family)
MSGQKHAFLFFTKAPTAGLTKTRLTEARGGILTPAEAADFYQAVMLDTAEVGFKALEELNQQTGTNNGHSQTDTYDFFVCSTPAEERPRLQQIFDEAGPWPFPIHYISDHGSNFNEHFDDAFKQLWKLGYHSAVSIGGDLPLMSVSYIVRAFQWLQYFDEAYGGGGLVHCPCQACGVSLVGITEATPMDFDGVFYNPNGIPAMDAIINLSAELGIPVAALDTAADIDDTQDLAHAISLARSQAYVSQFQPEVMVPHRFLDWVARTGIVINTPPNTEHDPRELIDA